MKVYVIETWSGPIEVTARSKAEAIEEAMKEYWHLHRHEMTLQAFSGRPQ